MNAPEKPFRQREQGMLLYPARGLRRWFFRAPLVLWRLGLGFLLQSRMLVLTTTGRKSGRPRHTMLEFSHWNGRYYVSSGWGPRTDWIKNLQKDPRVTVQAHGRSFVARARFVLSDEDFLGFFHAGRRSPVWKPFLKSFEIEDALEDFLAKKSRLTLLCFDPTSEQGPACLRADLAWIWIAIAILIAGLYFLTQ